MVDRTFLRPESPTRRQPGPLRSPKPVKTFLVTCALALACSGCATPARTKVAVSATASHGAKQLTKFAILPGPGITRVSDFDNVSNVLVFALIDKGFVLGTLEDAEIIIAVDYRPANSTTSRTVTTPVYGTKPGPVSLVNATASRTGGVGSPVLVSGVILNVPQTTVVGQESTTITEPVSGVRASVGAYDAAQIRRNARAGTGNPPARLVWSVDAALSVQGEKSMYELASDVMRAVADYAAKESGGPLEVEVTRSPLGINRP